jgi:imidazoleglycerol-phosphate dehydratase / histidinol-phosphatase
MGAGMSARKILFVDRDGTLIAEPADFQVDTLEKLELVPGVIPALLALSAAGYRLVMVTNQDGLGTPAYPREAYETVQAKLLQLLGSQGVRFDAVLVCPHREEERCLCRKPHLGLVREYLTDGLDRERSAVVGDRATDVALAANMGVRGFRLGDVDWPGVRDALLSAPRIGRCERATRETSIRAELNLDGSGDAAVSTGIGFLDHMLEQLARHSGADVRVAATGDLHVDSHHLVEDVALALGEALRRALGDKHGIGRYGFTLPMDESRAEALLDLSGRPVFRFEGSFPGAAVGGLPTELVPHFFRSFAEASGTTLHLSVRGENTHHMVEALFKAWARALGQAIRAGAGAGLPSTKGAL